MYQELKYVGLKYGSKLNHHYLFVEDMKLFKKRCSNKKYPSFINSDVVVIDEKRFNMLIRFCKSIREEKLKRILKINAEK